MSTTQDTTGPKTFKDIDEAVDRTLEVCALEIRKILKDEYGAERLDEIVARIRALRDEP
jgi:hypothetical protein